jgi:hypothetical protein
MDWVYTGDRAQLNTRNINVAYSPTTGIPYPLVGGTAAANYINRPYPGWGTVQMNRTDGEQDYRALQTAFTKRMANHWQASATYTYARTRVFDQLPLNPGLPVPGHDRRRLRRVSLRRGRDASGLHLGERVV